jgi:hypothetical protein
MKDSATNFFCLSLRRCDGWEELMKFADCCVDTTAISKEVGDWRAETVRLPKSVIRRATKIISDL